MATFRVLFAVAAIYATAVSADWEDYESVLKLMSERKDFDVIWQQHEKNFEGGTEQYLSAPESQCTGDPSDQVPTSAHQVRPADIKVIGALGDSLTAANGANASGVVRVLREYRGYSWSIGGYKDFESGITTLPNLLKMFNEDLVGYSTKTGRVDSRGSGLNVAVPGSKAFNMPAQAVDLVDKLKSNRKVNMEKDWKIVTLFVGGNDLCDYCKDKDRYSPENYVSHIREALDHLHDNLPRTIVNLVSIFDITPVANLGNGLICKTLHLALCNCGRKEVNAEMLKQLSSDYSQGCEDLVTSGRYDDRDDFTVVFQPFLQDAPLPTTDDGEADLSYFSPDCFHFSGKGHAAAATMLWNSMFQPVGLKSRAMAFDTDLVCPVQGAFIATTGNSV